MHRVHLQNFLHDQCGKLVAMDFVKADGGTRKLNGRLGVSKHLKGERVRSNGALPYLVVYDVKRNGYRNVNLATLSKLRAQHVEYTVMG